MRSIPFCRLFPFDPPPFFVDTNVWYWQTYTRASQSSNAPNPRQTRLYPGYLHNALRSKSRLLRCGLSLGELCHLIEKVEYELAHGAMTPKEFRHVPAERAKVVGEMKAAWAQVEGMTELLDADVDAALTVESIKRITVSAVDPYDALMIEAALRAGVTQVLTDDGDFCTLSGITMFTANRGVLQAAKAAGKLVKR